MHKAALKKKRKYINYAKLKKSLKPSIKREMGRWCFPKGGETEKCLQPVAAWPSAPEFGAPRAKPL